MGQGISEVLPFAIGIAISPIPIIAIILILFSNRATANGLAFLFGWVAGLAVVGTAVYLFANAAKQASLSFSDVAKDRDALKAALEKVSIDTPLGPFSFTSDHDVHQPIYVVAMDGTGGFTLVDTVQP